MFAIVCTVDPIRPCAATALATLSFIGTLLLGAGLQSLRTPPHVCEHADTAPERASEPSWFNMDSGLCTFHDLSENDLTVTFESTRTLLFTEPPYHYVINPQEASVALTSERSIMVSSNAIFAGRLVSLEDGVARLHGTNMWEWTRPDCECVALPPGLGESEFVAPAFSELYNSTCSAWDDSFAVACSGADAPDYCRHSWCYVSSECEAAFPSTYFPDADLYFSYDVCQDVQVDNAWTRVHPRKCTIFDTPLGGVNGIARGTCTLHDGVVNADFTTKSTDGMVLLETNATHDLVVRIEDLVDPEALLRGFVGKHAAIHNADMHISMVRITELARESLHAAIFFSSRYEVFDTPFAESRSVTEACLVAIDPFWVPVVVVSAGASFGAMCQSSACGGPING